MWFPLAIATDSRSGLKTFSITAIACLALCSALQAQVTVNTGSGTIIELYNQDALLAYDANYCDPDNGLHVCKSTAGFDTFSGLSTDVTYDFYVKAGQGTPSCSGSNCPYATVINQAHGYH